jgi:hypothetical protein
MITAIITFLAGIFIGRYFMVVKNHAQILNDIERVNRILDIKNNVSIISPSKLNEQRNIEKNLTEQG